MSTIPEYKDSQQRYRETIEERLINVSGELGTVKQTATSLSGDLESLSGAVEEILMIIAGGE